jgi:xeroderma pigmentosum group C-complementing protein
MGNVIDGVFCLTLTGHFEGAVLAPIRRFSQLPEYVRRNKSVFHGKDVLMYCTGGIRCEKAAKYLASFGEVGEEGDRDGGNQTTKNQFTKSSEAVIGRPRSVRQLRGGIVAYARDVMGSAGDVDEVGADQGADQGAELKSSTTVKSAYLGKNFVFDNRGATRVSGDVVSWCDGCGVRSDRLGKCESVGCHVILIVCEKCGGGKGGGGGGEVFCCGKCESQEVARVATPDGKRKRMPCDCDGYEARERRLLPTPTPR